MSYLVFGLSGILPITDPGYVDRIWVRLDRSAGLLARTIGLPPFEQATFYNLGAPASGQFVPMAGQLARNAADQKKAVLVDSNTSEGFIGGRMAIVNDPKILAVMAGSLSRGQTLGPELRIIKGSLNLGPLNWMVLSSPADLLSQADAIFKSGTTTEPTEAIPLPIGPGISPALPPPTTKPPLTKATTETSRWVIPALLGAGVLALIVVISRQKRVFNQ